MIPLFGLMNNKKVVPYIFVGFPVLLIFGLVGYPVVYAFYMSLFDWNLFEANRPFRGLGNYIDLFSDSIFINAFWNTLLFAVAYVLLSLVIGLLLAMFVYHLPGKLQNFVKTIYFLPVITSMVPVAIAFMWLLRSTPDAPINYYLSYLGVEPVGWLTDIFWAFKTIIGVTLWKNAGFVMMIYLAGLLGISRSYYEAAEIDGATSWKIFRHITLPLLRHTTVFLMVTGFIGAFQVFTQVFVLTGGSGPNGSTDTLGYEIYQRAFNTFDMGSASSMGFIMFLFILAASFAQLKYFGGDEESGRKAGRKRGIAAWKR